MRKAIYSFFLILFLGGCSNRLELPVSSSWMDSSEPYASRLNCSLSLSSVIEFNGEAIQGHLGTQDEPMLLRFVGLDSNFPRLIGNMGTEVYLDKEVVGDVLYLTERTPSGNLNIFTIFRDQNIVILSKQYDLFSTPFGLMMMGECDHY